MNSCSLNMRRIIIFGWLDLKLILRWQILVSFAYIAIIVLIGTDICYPVIDVTSYNEPNRIGVSHQSHLRPETDRIPETLCSLEQRMIEKFQHPNNTEYYPTVAGNTMMTMFRCSMGKALVIKDFVNQIAHSRFLFPRKLSLSYVTLVTAVLTLLLPEKIWTLLFLYWNIFQIMII
jgi:hypothetical protein